WIGTAANTLTLQYDRWTDGAIDGAITRYDGQNASGHGVIGHLDIVIIDNIEGKRHLEDYLNLRVGLYTAITAHEHAVELGAVNDSILVIDPENAAPNTTTATVLVQLYPNPSNGLFHLRAQGKPLETVRVFDLAGRQIANQTLSGMNADLDLREIPNGTYLVQVAAGKRIFTRRVIVQH
ncbi:MAG: T9SS type A sorting domain-containing protein, partial [Bacteroidota bacterium]